MILLKTLLEKTFLLKTLKSINIVKRTPSMFPKIHENIRSKNLFLRLYLITTKYKREKKMLRKMILFDYIVKNIKKKIKYN